MYPTCEGYELHTAFQWDNLKERDYLENLGIGGRIILKLFSKK
jgi:hypothetical protein